MSNKKIIRKELKVEDRGMIVGMRKIGHSFNEISSITSTPVTTVKSVYSHYIKHSTTNSLKRSGRPPIISERDTRALLRLIEANRKITLTQIQLSWPSKLSICTIRRIIHKLGLRSCHPRKKPHLNEKHKKDRLKWAMERKNWGVEDWKKIIWTDESSVEIGKNSTVVKVWRHRGEEWELSCLLPTFSSGRSNVMVWGCFVGDTIGPLTVIPRDKRTGVDYRDLILEGQLHNFYLSMYDIEDGVFLMEDGAPTHRSKAAGDWREENKIQSLPWPAQSPDLNPIENIWHTLKSRVNRRPRIPKNEKELIIALQEEWKQIPQQYLSNTVASMPDRIKMVISHKGGPTSY